MSDEAFLKRIHEDVVKTGFPTEVVAASSLTKVGWHCELGRAYLDEQTQQSREFDIRAFQRVTGRFDEQPYYFGVYLMIECKKSARPWVFFTHENAPALDSGRDLGRFIAHRAGHEDNFWEDGSWESPGHFSSGTMRAYHHYFDSKRWGHSYYEAFKKENVVDHSTQIYTAIYSAVNATRFYLNTSFQPEERQRSVFYPVIVLEGDIFEAVVHSADEVELHRRDHIIHKHHLIPANQGRFDGAEGVSYLIDIVRASALRDYADTVVKSHATMIEAANREAREQEPGSH